MQVVNSKESMDDDDDLAGCDCSWPGLQTCGRRRTAPVCHLSPRTPPVEDGQERPMALLHTHYPRLKKTTPK